MRFCSNCGEQLGEQAKFCSSCGTKVENIQNDSSQNVLENNILEYKEDGTYKDPINKIEDTERSTLSLKKTSENLKEESLDFGSVSEYPSESENMGFGSSSEMGNSNSGFGSSSEMGSNSSGFGSSSEMGSNSPGFGSSSGMGSNSPGFGSSSEMGSNSPGFGSSSGMGSNSPGFGSSSGMGNSNPGFGSSSGMGNSNPGFGSSSGMGSNNPGFGSSSGMGSNNPGFGSSSGMGNPSGQQGIPQGSMMGNIPPQRNPIPPAQMHPKNPNQKKNIGILIGIIGGVALLMILGIIAVFLVLPKLVKKENAMAGSYTAEIMELEGEEFSAEDLTEYGWIVTMDVNKDGSGKIYVFDEEVGFKTKGNKVLFEDGTKAEYSYDKKDKSITLTIDENNYFIFEPVSSGSKGGTNSIKGSDNAESNSGDTDVNLDDYTTFDIPSYWYGYIELTDFKDGYKDREDEFFDIWASIGRDDTNKPYFEIYDTEDASTEAILSTWIEDNNMAIVPNVSDGESWIFDRELIDTDIYALTTFVDQGLMEISYDYIDDTGSYTVYIALRLKGEDWPEGEKVPPGYNGN